MKEQTLREELVAYGLKLLEADLVQGTWGNLSVRLDEAHMLVTPSGIDYTLLTPDDIVKVDLQTLAYEGNMKPTSEKALHQGAYLLKPNAGAVIHTHADACSVLAAARVPLPACTEALKTLLPNGAPLAAYGLPGTGKLAKRAVAALKTSDACLLAHHGAVCCGADLAAAFALAEAMEQAANAYIDERNGR